ncbi:bifunctional 2-polyprenyl-6-hydroxyphenol methylase/3-demethylubiquinol 3-O-methyltransferase UbiG [Emticicia sp. CRIBPO]|uniref:class I SAM-dependent methyltransferase n=1 Tax=Emticicia sp. CRIBPO TaxID=2683258 RepID=UPI001E2A3433|nr:class I SAM-dependent methyltransferase [Emticicia sp. CRIBPO]
MIPPEMTDTRQIYNIWAGQYDTNINKTRDLEAEALKEVLEGLVFGNCLEIGCGTGKNTSWLVQKARQVTAVDFSEEMMRKAKEKVTASNVRFIQADITRDWDFAEGQYDLITFSLVLEHMDDLVDIFRKASKCLSPEGNIYVGELHPFRQYSGSKARVETEQGVLIPECFNHHISDFIKAAGCHGLRCTNLNEYFDQDDRNTVPRILTLVFKR